jgi:glutathione peroxidase
VSEQSVHDIPLRTLAGEPTSLGEWSGKAVLVVNVASKCGLTPQYDGLEELHEQYTERGFSVVGFPCNQFGGQEPGTAEEIQTFCSTTYGVTFPLFEKADVNGEQQQPLYTELTKVADADGVVQLRLADGEQDLTSVVGRPEDRQVHLVRGLAARVVDRARGDSADLPPNTVSLA